MKYEIVKADYTNLSHGDAIIRLLDEYACENTGGGDPLKSYTRNNLINALNKLPFAFSLLAMENETAVGLANCFFSFSTFQCRKIINIHDLIVSEKSRNKGVAFNLLNAIEEIAGKESCCKITLEVLSENSSAKNLYKKSGFKAYQLDPSQGHALFWEKIIK